MSKRLLVIIPDRLDDLVRKGEITERYYNPGNLFDEILLVKTIADTADVKEVQKMAGNAKLTMVDLPAPSFKQSLGYMPFMLKDWVNQGIELAREFKPDLIRAHSNLSSGYLAAKIKLALRVPMIVSLHTQPDVDMRGHTPWWPTWEHRMVYERYRVFEDLTNKTTDWMLPVYDAGMVYCKDHGVKRAVTCYNALNPTHISRKTDYSLHNPVRILCVNRLIDIKNPDNIIRSIKFLPDVELTIIGQGELSDYEKRVAEEAGVSNRVHFIPSIPNDELCGMYKDFDIYSSHVECWGIGKSTIEALLTGLPVVLNNRESGADPVEYTPDMIKLVPNNPESFAAAYRALIENNQDRETLGQNAARVAEERWSPRRAEAHFVEIYQQALVEAHSVDIKDWQPDYRSLAEIRATEGNV